MLRKFVMLSDSAKIKSVGLTSAAGITNKAPKDLDQKLRLRGLI